MSAAEGIDAADLRGLAQNLSAELDEILAIGKEIAGETPGSCLDTVSRLLGELETKVHLSRDVAVEMLRLARRSEDAAHDDEQPEVRQ